MAETDRELRSDVGRVSALLRNVGGQGDERLCVGALARSRKKRGKSDGARVQTCARCLDRGDATRRHATGSFTVSVAVKVVSR